MGVALGAQYFAVDGGTGGSLSFFFCAPLKTRCSPSHAGGVRLCRIPPAHPSRWFGPSGASGQLPDYCFNRRRISDHTFRAND